MITHRYDDGIYAIDAEYLMPLFDAVHLVIDKGRVAFIDCGTAYSVPAMLAALDELGVKRDDVDWLLLTHVHLDHAGGAGHLMQALPNAKAIVHPQGAPHIVDPRKLIEASIAVYGRELYDRLYDELLPIEQSRVVSTIEGQRVVLGGREFEILHTPGHALHHQTFFDHGSHSVFTGDTLGLSYRAFDVEGRAFGVPTTSPSQFNPSQLIESIRRILARRPKAAFLTHYARIDDLERVGADLIRMIEAHVATALSYESESVESARPAIRAALKEVFVRELRQFGSTAPDDAIEHWLGGDLDLNTDGLLAWLARRNRG